MKTTVIAMLVAAGCGAGAPSGLQECKGDEIALVLGCGPRQSDRTYGHDEDGREYVTCSVGNDRECIIDVPGASYHCMPRPACALLCHDGSFVCGE